MSVHSIEQVLPVLLAAKEVALLSHYNPDSDAYGAVCALGLGLEGRGVKIRLVNEDGPNPRYFFIPGVDRIENSFPPDFKGVVVVCDCGDLRRVGKSLESLVGACPCVINIDHHVSNELFGHYNLVVETASSTCEIIFDVLQAAGIKVSEQIARGLFAGIMGDTGSFRYSNATQKAFYVAEKLVAAGANPQRIGEWLFSNNTLAAVRLHAEALSALQMHFDGRVCEVIVDAAMLERCGAVSDDTDLLVEKARDIEGVAVSYLIQIARDEWRISMRSRDEAQNVSLVARAFGGGGHKSAAGFRWQKTLEELRPLLLAEIKKVL